MATIYEQHDASFQNVAAYVVAKDGERVATIAFKYPRDGAGRLYAYVHWLGYEMVRGQASGYGYDKHSAACADASRKMRSQKSTNNREGAMFAEPGSDADKFINAIGTDGGHYWNDYLRQAGFDVWQAI